MAMVGGTTMPSAFSMDLRSRVVAARDAGQTTKEVAERFEVSEPWVRRLMQRRRQTGSIAPKAGKPGPKPKLADHGDELRQLVREKPDATLEELRADVPIRVSIGTMWNTLRRLGLTRKKESHPRLRATAA
jgi:transposase